MKECSTCKRDDVKFNKNNTKPDGLQSVCVDCAKASSAKAYKADPKAQYDRIKNHRKKIRQFIFDYLKSHPCIDCGEKDPIVLEFDHLLSKKINISETPTAGWSLQKVGEEIGKCEVRCSNCHARKTAIQFGWYKDLL
jgi:hypothetical protein